MPAYKLHELWLLPFALTVDLLAAQVARVEQARTGADDRGHVPRKPEVEQRLLSNGKYEPAWFAQLRAGVGG